MRVECKIKNGSVLSISKAAKEDAESIIAYLNIVGGESDNLLFGKNGFHMSVEDEEAFIESTKDSAVNALLVGKVGGEIVCVGSIISPNRERIAHQSNVTLSVKKAFWNLGVGTKLMESRIHFARASGRTQVMHLSVRAGNENAIRLYKKMGFEEIGVYKKFVKIEGIYYDDILMNLYL